MLVLGLGETGLSLARYLHTQGARLCIADSRMDPPGIATLRSELPQAELHCGPFGDELLHGIDRIAIYRLPILWECDTREQVVAEVRTSVIHELGHYFGLDESELPP